MAIELDVEAVAEASGKTGFDRSLAVLVGVAAVLAGLLASLEVDASKQEERALHMASRLSVQIFEGTAGSSPRFSFQINSLQHATMIALDATAAQIAVLSAPQTEDSIQGRAEADGKAAERLLAAAQTMGGVPPASTGLDAVAQHLVGSSVLDLNGVVAEQNRQVDVANRYGERGNRAIFGLSLVALGAVLVGLASVLGRGVPGRAVIVMATLALVAAAGWGIAALTV